ncbi:hypothetical protein BGZ74_002224 [Mortierella antarctica]|nr:hypothetical protein BGZ74_002224 [Mortierella antarctica]
MGTHSDAKHSRSGSKASSSSSLSQPASVDLTTTVDGENQTQGEFVPPPLLKQKTVKHDPMTIGTEFDEDPEPERRPQFVPMSFDDGAYMQAVYMVRNIRARMQTEDALARKMTSNHDLNESHKRMSELFIAGQKWVAVIHAIETGDHVARQLAAHRML